MADDPSVRDLKGSDLAAVTRIYNHYISTSTATFEEVRLDGAAMSERVGKVLAAGLPWLVACRSNSEVVGYAYARPFHERAAYRHSVEVAVYVSPSEVGRGIGSLIYDELIRRLKAMGVHAVLAGVAPPNDASIALHNRFGFEKVGHYREVGFKFDRWIDVVYFQLLL